MNMTDKIRQAQIVAGENAVIDDLVEKGLIERPVSSMQREIDRLRAEAANFQMAYRSKCDAETKVQAVRIDRLSAILAELVSLYDQRIPLRERPDVWAAARAVLT